MRIKTNLRYLPSDGRNLAVRAAVLFQQETGIDLNGADIEIRKNVPVCAGMAGGSSDAAAVLRGLNEMTGAGISLPDLARMGKVLGADVPYCVMGGTMLAEGIGERLTPLRAVPKCHVVICKPRFSTSTAQAFTALDGAVNVRAFCRRENCLPGGGGAPGELPERVSYKNCINREITVKNVLNNTY